MTGQRGTFQVLGATVWGLPVCMEVCLVFLARDAALHFHFTEAQVMYKHKIKIQSDDRTPMSLEAWIWPSTVTSTQI